MTGEAGYVRLGADELRRRAAAASKLLAPCRLCPRECGVDRLQDQHGACATGAVPIVASWGPHFGEEPVLVGPGGSGTIFFSGCNLDCVYCQNAGISQEVHGGAAPPDRLAAVMLALQRSGCANINLVSPSHVVPAVLRALSLAVADGLELPLVYNTGGYDSLETLALLAGVVDVYMPDMKYADPMVGLRLSSVPDYPQRNWAAVLAMHRQVGDLTTDRGVAEKGLLVRHLVLPGGLSGTAMVTAFVAERVSPRTAFNLMSQYHPCHLANQYPPLNRRLTAEEWRGARQLTLAAGLTPLRDA